MKTEKQNPEWKKGNEMLNRNIKKIAVVWTVVFGLSAMTVWGNTETGSAEGKTIRVAAQSYPLYSPINAAYELGYFDEEFEAILNGTYKDDHTRRTVKNGMECVMEMYFTEETRPLLKDALVYADMPDPEGAEGETKNLPVALDLHKLGFAQASDMNVDEAYLVFVGVKTEPEKMTEFLTYFCTHPSVADGCE